jgi:hypothetical protein
MANSSNTAKQEAVRNALAKHPREIGEQITQYCRRIAAIAGVNWNYVHYTTRIIACERIGAEVRAREAEDSKTRLVPYNVGLGPIQNFRGWLEFFSKLKMLAEAYLLLAQSRGDVYATAYLKDVRDTADRASTRAAISKTG